MKQRELKITNTQVVLQYETRAMYEIVSIKILKIIIIKNKLL